MGKRRQNAKYRTFYWKSMGETNPISLNFVEMLCKETNLYCFKNQGRYASSSEGLKLVDVSVAEL
jgi:hypothetical protein